MVTAFAKDIYREIKNTLGRFLGIFAIVALGVAFYSGLGATGTDMQLTGNKYFTEQNLMDIRVISSYGISKKDAAAIAGAEGVEAIHAARSVDAQVVVRGNATVLKVHGIDMAAPEETRINRPVLLEGRMPLNSREILVEQSFLGSTGYKTGDTVRLESGKKRDIRNSLKTDTYTIAGVVRSPLYISHERGSGSIGGGSIDCYAFIPQENFRSELYSEVYVKVRGADALMCFGDEYEAAVDAVVKNIEKIGDVRIEERFREMTEMSYEQLNQSERDIKNALNDAYSQYGEGNDITDGLERSLAEIADARDELNELDAPKWYVLDRASNPGYASFSDDSDKIAAIGNVFPLIFFLVAALVSLTTMTRMVEERRVEIGTLKSLGYGGPKIMSKYIIYAAAPTLLGGLLGGYAGMKLFPYIIITMYNMMYSTPPPVTPVNARYWTIALVMAAACTIGAAAASCMNELKATPANLMRPKAPKAGKRTVVERITPLWRALSFTYKVTVRNLLRYKKRFLMTVIGIAGCTALLMTGFGVKDSISDIMTLQFGEINLYDMTVSFSDSAKNSNISNVRSVLTASQTVRESLTIRQKAMDAGIDEKCDSGVTLIVPENAARMRRFINLREAKTGEPLELSGGVIITEKLAKNLNVKKGGHIYLKDGDKLARVRVDGIAEYYFLHYVYITPETYKTLFKEDVPYNAIVSMLTSGDKAERDRLARDILDKRAVTSVSYTQTLVDTFSGIIGNLDFVVLILILSAGALAFVVLLNLTNINISERVRELATIEVLGFYDKEVSAYVFRENIALTAIGIAAGLFMGIALHAYIMSTVETENMMFGSQIKPMSYLYSVLLTALFAWCVNIISSGKLRRINMVEALKSVE